MRKLKPVLFLLTLLFSGIVAAAPVNINTAGAAALAEGIDGVGPKLAQAIVDYRTANGPFKSVQDLENIKGIGPVLIERNSENLTVESE